MTPNQIVAVCLRLVALIWLLYTLNHMYGLFSHYGGGIGLAPHKWVVWLFAGLQIATCAVLWFFPATIAARLLPSRASARNDPPPEPQLVDWQTLGVIIVGLWGLSSALPSAVYWAAYIGMSAGTGIAPREWEPEMVAGLLSTAAELLIGCWLVFGAKGIAAFLLKIRTGGVSK